MSYIRLFRHVRIVLLILLIINHRIKLFIQPVLVQDYHFQKDIASFPEHTQAPGCYRNLDGTLSLYGIHQEQFCLLKANKLEKSHIK